MPVARVSFRGLPVAYRIDDYTDPWTSTPTLVMVHGFARNGEFWRAWIPYLARWMRVMRVDLPGCGEAGPPSSKLTVEIEVLSEALWGLLDHLELGAVSLLGESSGGVLCAWMAAHRPERVTDLVLVSTPMRLLGKENAVKNAGYPNVPDALDALGGAAYWLESRGRGGQLTGNERRDRHFAELFAKTPTDVAKAYWNWVNGSGVDLEPVLPSIRARTLLMSPGASFGTSGAEQDRMGALIPDCRHHLFPEFTHEMYYVEPDALAPVAAEFLKGHA